MSTSKMVSGTTGNMTAMLDEALAAGWTPNGSPILATDGTFYQLMYKGLSTGGAGGDLPDGSVAVANGDTVPVRHISGSDIVTGTIAVVDDALNSVVLPETTALTNDGDEITIGDGHGHQATATIAVAGGVISSGTPGQVDLSSNSAIVNDQQTLDDVASVTGAYVDTVTVTVEDGAITAIVLS